MSPPGKPRSEEIRAKWSDTDYIVLTPRPFLVYTSSIMPIYDFDTYTGFTKHDLVNDIIRAFKEHNIQTTARIYETSKGIRLILPHVVFDNSVNARNGANLKPKWDMEEFIKKIPHHDPLYLMYLRKSGLFRARVTPKQERLPKYIWKHVAQFNWDKEIWKYRVTKYLGTVCGKTYRAPVGEQSVNAGVAKLCKFKSKCKFETTNAFFHGYRVNTDVNAYCKGVYDTYVQSSYPSFANIFLHDFITKAHVEVDQSDFHDRATKANIRRLY